MSILREILHRNRIKPKSGAEPLTVVGFSLLDKVSLQSALRPYVTGEIRDEKGLAKIIEDHFPPEVLKELEGVTSDPTTVFIIKNLPEIDPKRIPEQLKQGNRQDELKTWLSQHSYTNYIIRGVASALHLQSPGLSGSIYPLIRYPGMKALANKSLHNHGEAVSMLGGIETDGAKTLFADVRT